MPEKTELQQLREHKQKLEQKVMAIELEKIHFLDKAKIKLYII